MQGGQLLHAGVGNLGSPQVQSLEALELGKVLHARISDGGVV
jgi:hypothetical protein